MPIDIYRHSLIFRYVPENPGGAFTPSIPGGWTENFWYPTKLTNMETTATKRAAFLSSDAEVTGFRIQRYSLDGRNLTPRGTTVGTFAVSGKGLGTSGMPQDCLEVLAKTGNEVNSLKLKFASIPDQDVQQGQWVPGNQDRTNLNTYLTWLRGGIGPTPISWLGRDNSQVAARVLTYSLVGVARVPTVLLSGPVGAAAGTDFVRFHRVTADNGLPIKGAFLVTKVTNNADTTQTLELAGGPDLVLTRPSGTARKDVLATAAIASTEVTRMVSRKIGRPTTSWRGRRSRSRG